MKVRFENKKKLIPLTEMRKQVAFCVISPEEKCIPLASEISFEDPPGSVEA